MTDWVIEHLAGTATELFLGRRSSATLLADVVADPQLRFLHVDRPTLVMGSSQPDHLFASSENAEGSDAYGRVRRRSGGGAVWLDPHEQVWVDVIVPMQHQLWESDVTSSFDWLGQAWRATIASLGVASDRLSVHAGAMRTSPWSELLCFAGVGPGELFIDGRKVVGISQRRSRNAALFQCGALLHWSVDPLIFSAEARCDKAFDDVEQVGIGLVDVLGATTALQLETAFVDQIHRLGSQRTPSR